MKYKIAKCTTCGEITGYAPYIRTKCRTCGKAIKIKKAFVLAECEKPGEIGYLVQRIKEELAKKSCQFEKKTNYINRRD